MARTGVDRTTVGRWLDGSMKPGVEKAVRFAILHGGARGAEAPATGPAGGVATEKDVPDPWLDREWREIHTFTAMVTALRRLERQFPLGSQSPQRWRTRVGWEAMLAGREMLLAVADWTDSDWRMIFDKGADLWRRPKPGQRSEEETLRERLQIPLGFDTE